MCCFSGPLPPSSRIAMMTADLFMLDKVHQVPVTSNINLLCLDTADHLLFKVPQMNADPAMSRSVYHSVWLLQTTSSYSSS